MLVALVCTTQGCGGDDDIPESTTEFSGETIKYLALYQDLYQAIEGTTAEIAIESGYLEILNEEGLDETAQNLIWEITNLEDFGIFPPLPPPPPCLPGICSFRLDSFDWLVLSPYQSVTFKSDENETVAVVLPSDVEYNEGEYYGDVSIIDNRFKGDGTLTVLDGLEGRSYDFETNIVR